MPHGATLSVVYPAWFKLQKERNSERLSRLAELIFDNPNVDKFITDLENFFISINSPINLKSEGFSESEKDVILQMMKQNKVNGNNYQLSEVDYSDLINLMFG